MTRSPGGGVGGLGGFGFGMSLGISWHSLADFIEGLLPSRGSAEILLH